MLSNNSYDKYDNQCIYEIINYTLVELHNSSKLIKITSTVNTLNTEQYTFLLPKISILRTIDLSTIGKDFAASILSKMVDDNKVYHIIYDHECNLLKRSDYITGGIAVNKLDKYEFCAASYDSHFMSVKVDIDPSTKDEKLIYSLGTY